MADADVLVVGAGLAGLTCALTLRAAGREVVVLEAADGVGGRIRTEVVDGYRLDRGFQVLLTGYPAARRWFDYDALDLQAFSPGVVIRHLGRFRRLEERGFSPAITAGFFSPFLAGTFFDPGMTTSSRVTELVFRSFFRGEVAVPALGMQQLPEQLAAQLPLDTVRLGHPVTEVGHGTVTVDGGDRITADQVVVATEGPAAYALLGERFPGAVAPDRGTATVYYRAPEPPLARPDLVLDADRDGPVNNLAVMSEVAPSYAPPGGDALVSVATVGVPAAGDVELDAAIRTQLADWYGPAVHRWERLAGYRIPHAQPRQDVEDLPSLAREVRVDDTTWVCGDHRDTSSIQGALVSGRRTAEALLATAS